MIALVEAATATRFLVVGGTSQRVSPHPRVVVKLMRVPSVSVADADKRYQVSHRS